MKLFRTTVLFVCLLLTGCIGENRDNCPPNNNLILRLSYTNSSGDEVFRERIQQTELFLFDESDNLVGRQTIGTDQLDASQSIALSLKPGTYRFVGWGHQVTRTGFSSLELNSARLEDGYIFNNTLQGTTAATGDAWYFAPRASAQHANGYFLTVPPTGSVSQTLHFTSSFVGVELYIQGFTDPDGQGGNHPPQVEITDLGTQVDFTKGTFGPLATYVQGATHEAIQGTQMATAYFTLPPFNNDNPLNIHIKKADGTLVHTENLKNYLTTNNLSVENSEEPVVPIHLEFGSNPGDFMNVVVSIGIPGWLNTNVKPGL